MGVPSDAVLDPVVREWPARTQDLPDRDDAGPLTLASSPEEDLIPRDADARLFKVATYLVFLGMIGNYVVLPFSEKLVI